MAENDTMEGKNLAIKEKIDSIVDKIKNGEDVESEEILIITKNAIIPLDVEKDEEKGSYKVNILDVHILTLENDELKFKEGWEDVLRQKAEGITDVEDIITELKEMEMSLEKEKKENQKDERQRDEKDLSDNMEEQEKDNPEKEKQEEDEKDSEEQTREQKKDLIKLNDKVLKVLIPSAKGYGNIYLDPDSGEIVGKNKSTGEIEPIKGLSQIKGTNSNKNIHGMEDGKHKHVNALKMYQIDSRPNTGISILRDGTEKGNFDVKFTTRKVDSNDIRDFAYVDIPLLASQARMGEGRAKEISGVRQGTRGQGEQDRVQDEVDELNEEIEVPEEITKAFDTEMQKQSNYISSLKQFKEMLYKVVKEQLDSERPNDFPDSHNAHAKFIVDKMVEENKGYEQSKDEVYNGKSKDEVYNGKSKDDEGENEKQPGEDPRKREH